MPQQHLPPSATPETLNATEPASGNVNALEVGGILLPDFIVHGKDGLYVCTAEMGDAESLQRFVDRVFSVGACFAGLDYETLSQLLYSRGPIGHASSLGQKGMLRLADGIHSIEPERRALYKSIRSIDDGARVEYLFEPVKIEREIEVPLIVEDVDGQPQITGYEKRVQREPATLNVDEFIAAMWEKGVRSGLDIPAIQTAIASGQVEHIVVARRIDPAPGADASVQEKTQSLHRDDSPFILPNGRVDLGQFKNHFPQVSAGTTLLQKMPRRFGVIGFATDGSVLEPDAPRDFDLEDMAGIGTRIDRTAKGEFLIAARDGFLDIDKATGQISVTDKIINHEGVSIRTTGNLALTGEVYEEYGEVQERRVIEGKHMTFHADVFGNIVSDGGDVHFMGNLSGGTVKSPGGLIQIDHRVSQSILEARGGEVRIKQAEGVTIVAKRVRIERAVACDIAADDVEIDDAAACTIVARQISAKRVGAYRDTESLFVICVPDFSELNKSRAASTKQILELTQRKNSKQEMFDSRIAVSEIRNYLSADKRIRDGELKLSPEQQMQWHVAAQRLAKPLFELQSLQHDIDAIEASLAEESIQLAAMDARQETESVNIGCDIGQVVGDLAVQSQTVLTGVGFFSDGDVSDIKRRLRDPRAKRKRLFRGSSGTFSWNWTAQDSDN